VIDRPKHPSPDDEQTIALGDQCGGDEPTAIDSKVEASCTDPTQPDFIGDFRIIGRLGEGGMGVVWEAEQERPRRRVAFKVMRRDHLVDDLHTRMFHREAESLARLRHPNIAAIYESGHTDDGHDYFAMELVRGDTLDEWLAKRSAIVDNAELKLRLRLFRAICDAVHYAHQRGVIHRDLKPSNIIVTDEAASTGAGSAGIASPTVKILDFGLARITDSDIAATLVSEIGTIKGTLPYMSPEQARGDVMAIDVRADVYALGVILYEMLTRRRPYDVSRAALAEAVRVICEEAPKPMSQSWTGTRRLNQDLETIVGKALQKEADRRYGSAAAVGEDVERYLTSQPILARPPSATYQLKKMIQRNRLGAAFAATVLVLLVGFGVTMAVQAKRVAAERDRANTEAATARQVQEFMVGLFEVADSGENRGHSITAREVLSTGADRIRTELTDQPQVRAALMETMGRVFRLLGLYDEAAPLLDESLALRREHLGDRHPDVGLSLHRSAVLAYDLGDYQEARRLMEEALDLWRSEIAPDDSVTAASLDILGAVSLAQGDFVGAEDAFRAELELRDESQPRELATTTNNLGLAVQHQGELDEAREHLERALEMRRELLGEANPATIDSYNNVAILLQDMKNFEGAKRYLVRAVTLYDEVYPDGHPNVPATLGNLAMLRQDMGDLDGAERDFEAAIEGLRKWLGEDHPNLGVMLNNYADVLELRGRLAEADAAYVQALEILVAALGNDHWLIGTVTANRGNCQHQLGRLSEAEQSYLDAWEILEAAVGADHRRSGKAALGLAELYDEMGRESDAAEWRARVGDQPTS